MADSHQVRQLSARRAATATVRTGATVAVVALIAGCGADTQSATAPAPSAPPEQSAGAEQAPDLAPSPGPEQSPIEQSPASPAPSGGSLQAGGLLAVDKPVPAVSGLQPSDCQAAGRVHDNKHNICATWINNAPNFIAPKTLVQGPINFTYNSIDAGGVNAHHINRYPGWFGTSTWAATSAETGYGASMNWVFSAAEPSDTITGSATQDKDNGHTESCTGVQGYVGCHVTRSDMVGMDGNRFLMVTYDLINAPLTVMVVNNTGQQMTVEGSASFSNAMASARGSVGTASIAPASGGTANSAIFGGYRSTGGQAASFKVVYSFPDTNDRSVTHKVTVALEMVPSKASDFAAWGVDTSKSTCTDNPIGGSSPPKAQCTIGWTGNTTWFASAAATVNVSNS